MNHVPDDAMHYGDAVRRLREAKRMTMRVLAEAVGVSVPFISDLEHNRRRTTRHAEFARALDVPEDELRALDGRLTPAMQEWLAKNPKLMAFLEECRKQRFDPMSLVLK